MCRGVLGRRKSTRLRFILHDGHAVSARKVEHARRSVSRFHRPDIFVSLRLCPVVFPFVSLFDLSTPLRPVSVSRFFSNRPGDRRIFYTNWYRGACAMVQMIAWKPFRRDSSTFPRSTGKEKRKARSEHIIRDCAAISILSLREDLENLQLLKGKWVCIVFLR